MGENRKRSVVQGGQDLTEGPIGKKVFLFALPLFGSSLVQQLYNTVDLMFVGNILGKEASAAVGAGGLLITCVLGLFTGLSVGVGVVAAGHYGSKNYNALKRTIHTAAGVSAAGSVVLIILGWLLTPLLLRLLNTPDTIMEMAVTYMRIYFLSLFSIVSYNMSAGILRALGNSRSPLLYQLLGGFANVFGNTLFIYVLQKGVAGAAMATMLSQSVAALLTVAHLFRLPDEYRLRIADIRISGGELKRILTIGIPAAVQAMVITFSNIIVQSQINSLGVDSIAAFTVYFKVENFIYLPIMSMGQANTTFFSQNLGAGKTDRALQGTRTTLIGGSALIIAMQIIMLIFSRGFLRLFTADPVVIDLGSQIMHRTFPFYFLYVFIEVLSAALRGAGWSFSSMCIILVNMCGVRLLTLLVVMRTIHTAQGVAIVYPVTWACAVLCLMVYYQLNKKKLPGYQAAQ